MAAISSYNLYAFNSGADLVKKSDEVDSCIKDLENFKEYNEILDYVQSKFGSIAGEKLIDFPEIDKQIHILVEENKIGICAAKHSQQYYGNGWMQRNPNKE